MKVLVALCFFAAVAQAIDVDWAKVIPLEIVPPSIAGLLQESTKSSIGSRIVGGTEATPGQFPWQVAVLSEVRQGVGFCGGSIVSANYILTAAHCVDRVTGTVEVIIGAHNIVEDDSELRLIASEIIVHPAWSRLTSKDDIALLRLPTSLTFNERVQPIRLPRRLQADTSWARFTATVSGWGITSDDATAVSPVLNYVSNPILLNNRCTWWYFNQIRHTQICMAGDEGRSSCQGDSGGPLTVIDSVDGLIVQVGVVSHGIIFGCASGWPGVYTRTSAYLDWLSSASHGDIRIRL